MEDSEFRRYKRELDQSWYDDTGRQGRSLMNVVQVRVRRTRKIAWFRHDDLALSPRDLVVVETERGTTDGMVLTGPEKQWANPKGLKSVVRTLGGELDDFQMSRAREREELAIRTCSDIARRHSLDMKVVDVEYVHWENRTVFYFVSEGRVDFRELVKELSRSLRCRIEMRQIGPRDETKMLGGLGRCGREFCCATHMREFRSVRTKMAKEQGLVVNQEKITGHCSKLLCCLAHEREVYATLKQSLPALGARVETQDGKGKVTSLHVIKQSVRILLESGSLLKDVPATRLERLEEGEESGNGRGRYRLEPPAAAPPRPDETLLREMDEKAEKAKAKAEAEGRRSSRSRQGRRRRQDRTEGGKPRRKDGDRRRAGSGKKPSGKKEDQGRGRRSAPNEKGAAASSGEGRKPGSKPRRRRRRRKPAPTSEK